MTLLQLIAHLKEVYDHHGEMPVVIVDDEGWSTTFNKEDVFVEGKEGSKSLCIAPGNVEVL